MALRACALLSEPAIHQVDLARIAGAIIRRDAQRMDVKVVSQARPLRRAGEAAAVDAGKEEQDRSGALISTLAARRLEDIGGR